MNRLYAPHRGEQPRLVLLAMRRDESENRPADYFAGGIPEHPLRSRIPRGHKPVGSHAQNGIAAALHDRPQSPGGIVELGKFCAPYQSGRDPEKRGTHHAVEHGKVRRTAGRREHKSHLQQHRGDGRDDIGSARSFDPQAQQHGKGIPDPYLVTDWDHRVDNDRRGHDQRNQYLGIFTVHDRPCSGNTRWSQIRGELDDRATTPCRQGAYDTPLQGPGSRPESQVLAVGLG